jgi:integrase/recombinase XerD
MGEIRWERYPHVDKRQHAHTWLQIQANLGLAANTVEAYARALEEYLKLCSSSEVTAEEATKEHISWYVQDLMTRPNPRGANISVLDSGVGLPSASGTTT